jgi:uncharacterized protein YbjT (DUF2867 family)
MKPVPRVRDGPAIGVLGGTGRFGAPFIRTFLTLGLDVRILARSPGRVAGRFPDAAVQPGSMLDQAAVGRVLKDAAAAFLMTPVGGNDDTHIEMQAARTAIAAARAVGLPHLLYVSLIQPGPPTGVPMLDVKSAIEAALAASGIPWSGLRTGCYMDAWLNFFPLGKRLGLYFLPIRSRHRFSFTSEPDVARVAAQLVRRGRILQASVDVIDPRAHSLREVVALYARITGRGLRAAGGWLLPLLKLLQPILLRWCCPTAASRVALFDYFSRHDWTGRPERLAGILPAFRPTPLADHIRDCWHPSPLGIRPRLNPGRSPSPGPDGKGPWSTEN